jgi:hypothetical protein
MRNIIPQITLIFADFFVDKQMDIICVYLRNLREIKNQVF